MDEGLLAVLRELYADGKRHDAAEPNRTRRWRNLEPDAAEFLWFLVQAVGLIVLRIRRPDLARPFRMWFYPVPVVLASAGFLYILFGRPNWQKEVRYAAVILCSGVIVYMIRAWKHAEWPFNSAPAAALTNI